MEVKRIASFSQEEIEELKIAGTILGSIAKAKEAGEIDGLSEATQKLVLALKEVLGRIQ